MSLARDWLFARGVDVPPSIDLTSVNAISDSGRWIGGVGVDAAGGEVGWRADLGTTLGVRYCDPPAVNSTGAPAELVARGSLLVSEDPRPLGPGRVKRLRYRNLGPAPICRSNPHGPRAPSHVPLAKTTGSTACYGCVPIKRWRTSLERPESWTASA